MRESTTTADHEGISTQFFEEARTILLELRRLQAAHAADANRS